MLLHQLVLLHLGADFYLFLRFLFLAGRLSLNLGLALITDRGFGRFTANHAYFFFLFGHFVLLILSFRLTVHADK